MKRFHRAILLFILIGLPLFALQNGGDEVDDIQLQKKPQKFTKPLGVADEAVGVMDKGQLQNLTMNYGQLTDTRYEDRG
ncbi:hypothetical protein B1H10_05425, partial [candidate division KSB1 bacterium 4484_188]